MAFALEEVVVCESSVAPDQIKSWTGSVDETEKVIVVFLGIVKVEGAGCLIVVNGEMASRLRESESCTGGLRLHGELNASPEPDEALILTQSSSGASAAYAIEVGE